MTRRFLTILSLAAACSRPVSAPVPSADTGDADGIGDTRSDASDAAPDLPLEDRCITAVPWASGTPAFVERTDVAGFQILGVEGSHVTAVDWSGDGYPDLALRRDNTVELNVDDWFTGDRAFWLLENQRDGTFVDRTEDSGITSARAGGDRGRPAEIALFADVDNDGDLDAYTAFRSDGQSPEGAELMLNDGSGVFDFADTGQLFRRAGLPWAAYGAAFVDHNRDGRVDVWVVYSGILGAPQADSLYEQDESGGFGDRASLYGITSESSIEALNEGRGATIGWGATACDLNGDGATELLAASYARLPNKLWLGSFVDGTPAYENVSVESGYAFDEVQDWTDDESARCYCQLNPTAEDCAGVPPPAAITCDDTTPLRWNHATARHPYQLGGNTASTVCADLDMDGDLDLLNTELRHWDVGFSSDPTEPLLNDGADRPTFARPGRGTMGLARVHNVGTWDEGDLDAAVFDFDNDGRPDVWLGSSDYPDTRAHLYRQESPGQYVEVAFSDYAELERAKGIGIADFDRDGDLDVVAGRSSVRCEDEPECVDFHTRYYENVVGDGQNWVQLQLEGADGTNRSAIGARVTVDGGPATQVQEVGGGHGRLGIQHDLALHFGLGAGCEATITVRWPDADLSEETFTVAAGYRWRLRQGEAPIADRQP